MNDSPFTPEHLKLWTRPRDYAGASWPDYYVFIGRHRDSDALDRANFDAGIKAIGGECNHPTVEDPEDPGCALSLVRIVRETHWAVGWVEWIAIHKSAKEQLEIADKLKGRLDNYPILDEELHSEYETTEANEVWQTCYRLADRVAYIRKHRSQFDFRDWRDMLACVRGKYFSGYAGDILR